jgi:Na+/H+ antiporter NhaD/arsenite permease-like protein
MSNLIKDSIKVIKDFVNLKYDTKPQISNMSLSKALLMFYVLIGSCCTKDLYSGQFKDFLKSSRSAQHMLGFLAMLVLITCVAGVNDPYHSISYTTIAYFWFILTTKLDIHWNLAIVALLVIGFFYESKMVEKEAQSEEDPVLEEEDLENIKNKHNNNKSLIVILILLITFVGTMFYWNKKKVQYGHQFNVTKFIFDSRKTYKLTK